MLIRMFDGQIRIFVSGELIRIAETKAAESRTAVGRPVSHSACLLLAMIAVREFLGIGYRKTQGIFAERGYSKLPDFRTVGWRVAELKRHSVGIEIDAKKERSGHSIIVRHSGKSVPTIKKELSRQKWEHILHDMKEDFVELQL